MLALPYKKAPNIKADTIKTPKEISILVIINLSCKFNVYLI